MELEKGTVLYSLNVGNAARRQNQKLTPVVVQTVGRKYFTVRVQGVTNDYNDVQYHIEDWREKTEYTANSKLYESVEEYNHAVAAKEYVRRIGEAFKYGRNCLKLPYHVLQQINDLIEDNKQA